MSFVLTELKVPLRSDADGVLRVGQTEDVRRENESRSDPTGIRERLLARRARKE